ncbi:MAG: Hpt domain-containing protein [Pirellulales bacterium]
MTPQVENIDGDTGRGQSPFNLHALRTRLEDDDLLQELIELFLGNCPALLAALETSVANRDCCAIERAAHAMKGSLRNICADRCADAAWELESMGRLNDFAHAETALATLQNELNRVRQALQSESKIIALQDGTPT